MYAERVTALYFSPTGATARAAETVAEALAEHMGLPVEKRSFTRPAERERDYHFTAADIVVVASPTYAGKLPNKIVPDFRAKFRGNGAVAIPMVTFGNRAYENSLAELIALLTENGFRVAAAGAFVCRHAFTDELAYGRPGWSDGFEMKTFAKKTADKIKKTEGTFLPLSIPGDAAAPYYVPKGADGQPVMFLKAKPKTHLNRCNRCGACVRACPMAAIDPKDPSKVPGTCIKCHSCVRKCTKQAKYFDDPAFLSHVAMLERDCAEPKDNEMFL